MTSKTKDFSKQLNTCERLFESVGVQDKREAKGITCISKCFFNKIRDDLLSQMAEH